MFSSSWLSAETQISAELHTCTHFPRNIWSNKTNKKACILHAKLNKNTRAYYMHPYSISYDKARPIWIAIKDSSKKYFKKTGILGVFPEENVLTVSTNEMSSQQRLTK